MTLIEAAALLGVTSDNLRGAIKRGSLRAVKHGRDWWVDPKDVERYRLEHRRESRHWFVGGSDPLICVECGHPQWNSVTGPDFYHKGRPGQSQPKRAAPDRAAADALQEALGG